MSMTRRSFLKLLAAAPAAAAMPSLVFADIGTDLLPGQVDLGNVRESIEYDINHDALYVRYDVLCGKRKGDEIEVTNQFYVVFRTDNPDDTEALRARGIELLKERMAKEGFSLSDAVSHDNRLGSKIVIPYPTKASVA